MQDDETSKQTHTYIASHLDFLFANELVCVNITAKIEMSYWVALFVTTLLTLFSPQFIRKGEE